MVRNYLFTQLSNGDRITWQSPNGKCRRQTSMWSFRFTLQHKREQAVDNEVSLLKTMAAQPKANNYVPSRLEDLRRGR